MLRRACRLLAEELHGMALTASSSSACCSTTSTSAPSMVTIGRALRSRTSQLPQPSLTRSASAQAGPSGSAGATPRPQPSMASGTGMGSVLEEAAEARMTRIKAAEAAEAGIAPPSHAPPSVLRHLLSFLGRAIMVGATGAGIAAAYYTYRYDLSEVQTMVQETKAKKENAFVGSQLWVDAMETYIAARQNLEKQIKSFRDPTYERLLPDMRPEMKAMGIKTLVLDLNDVLVSKQWTRQKGWTLYKRPGAQDFLFEMGQYFEVVIYTDEPSAYAIPVINKLDKNQVVPFRLYRPETQYHEGKHVRDLSKLNRDLSQVLFISANPDAYAFQPENTLKLKPWKDDPRDTTLYDLLPMLQMIALKGVRDVRDVVKSYDGEEDVAKAFKKRMQQVSQHQKQSKPRGLLAFK